MSFWTGFTTGLASSVDRSLQNAMEKRDREISAAKSFWQQTRLRKMEAEDKEEAEYNKKAKEAYRYFADELGDPALATAAMKKLGTADDALALKNSIEERRSKLQPGDAPLDVTTLFQDIKKGTATLDYEQGEAQILYQRKDTSLPTGFSGATLGVDDPLGRLFGKEGQAAEKAAASLRKQTEATMIKPREEVEGLPTIGRIDRSMLQAAVEEGRVVSKIERDITAHDMKVSAFKQNTKRIDQAMEIADAAEARAQRKEATDADQRALDNARAEVAALQRQESLAREAEAHILNMRSKKIGIEKDELELQKAKSHPQFKDFEDMAVYATQKLSEGGLTNQQVADFERMRADAIAGAKAYNEQTETADAPTPQFSKESRQAILNGEIKRILEPKGLVTDIQGQLDYKIKGNETQYFDSMTRALDNVTEQVSGLNDARMNALIRTQRSTLQNNVNNYVEQVRASQKQGKKLVPTTKAESSKVNFTKGLKVGDIVEYEITTNSGEPKKVARIWTGTTYIRGY